MEIKGIIAEDFINYKKPAMVIEFPHCDFKCDKECGKPVCQNGLLANSPTYNIPTKKIVLFYLKNIITEAIVFQGLEPFDSPVELFGLIEELRRYTDDDIVIYTGYTEKELDIWLCKIIARGYKNIIIKFGRYIPDQPYHFDSVLGVQLASPNQYAKKIN